MVEKGGCPVQSLRGHAVHNVAWGEGRCFVRSQAVEVAFMGFASGDLSRNAFQHRQLSDCTPSLRLAHPLELNHTMAIGVINKNRRILLTEANGATHLRERMGPPLTGTARKWLAPIISRWCRMFDSGEVITSSEGQLSCCPVHSACEASRVSPTTKLVADDQHEWCRSHANVRPSSC